MGFAYGISTIPSHGSFKFGLPINDPIRCGEPNFPYRNLGAKELQSECPSHIAVMSVSFRSVMVSQLEPGCTESVMLHFFIFRQIYREYMLDVWLALWICFTMWHLFPLWYYMARYGKFKIRWQWRTVFSKFFMVKHMVKYHQSGGM